MFFFLYIPYFCECFVTFCFSVLAKIAKLLHAFKAVQVCYNMLIGLFYCTKHIAFSFVEINH